MLQTDYYYGINVVAQMATKDDDGLDNYERFGDEEHGGWTTDGQALMRLIVGIEYIYVHTQYWVPNTKEEMFDDAENIIIAKVINTEIKTGPDYVDEISGIKHVYTISTVLVEETLKGNFSANEEIMVIQPGDGKTIIVDRIDDIDGYLTDGSRWLLLLNKDDDIHKEWYLQNLNSDIMHMPMAGVGQYRLDGMDNIMVMSDISRHLLGSVDTVAEFKAMIEDYYTYPSD